MARTDELAQESLEMLLDTICNTFGAVLFIAMLVVTLVDPNAKEQTSKGSVTTEFVEVETEINSMQIEVDRLKLVLEQQETLLDRFSDPHAGALAASITEARKTQARLVRDRAGSLANLAQADRQNAETRDGLRRQQDALKKARSAAANAANQLADIARQKSRMAKTPKTIRLRTATIATILKGGVWYCITRPNAVGVIEVNTSDCDPIPNGTHQTLTPRLGGGVNIQNSGTKITPFRPSDPKEHHYTLFVYKDSFSEYRLVKDALAEAGFRVELILMNDGDFPEFGPGGQRDRWGA